MMNQVNKKAAPLTIRLRRLVHFLLGMLDTALALDRPTVMVFCYHSVAADNWRFSVSLDALEQQLDYLLSFAKPISPEELMEYINGTVELTSPHFLITFDDGYQDVASAIELFKRKGVRPLIFVLSNPELANRMELDNQKPLLNEEGIAVLHEAGWHIACHSASHADFSQLDQAGLDREVAESKVRLEQLIQKPVQYFAYPKGQYDERTVQRVQAAGYDLAFTVDHGVVSPTSDRYRLPRIGVDSTHRLEEFKVMNSKLSAVLKKIAVKYVGKLL